MNGVDVFHPLWADGVISVATIDQLEQGVARKLGFTEIEGKADQGVKLPLVQRHSHILADNLSRLFHVSIEPIVYLLVSVGRRN